MLRTSKTILKNRPIEFQPNRGIFTFAKQCLKIQQIFFRFGNNVYIIHKTFLKKNSRPNNLKYDNYYHNFINKLTKTLNKHTVFITTDYKQNYR